MGKNVTFDYQEETGGNSDTIKEINNMIETDETRGRIYCRTTNTKIVEFNCASNAVVAEFENLMDEKDSNNNDNFVYFFKVAKRKIFYTMGRKQAAFLYDMDTT